MLRKILLTGLLAVTAATTNIAMADAAPYVGASLGVVSNTSKTPANFRGIPFNVFAGYGGVVNQSLYLAGEAFWTIGTAEVMSGSARTTYGYGVSILPGVMLSDHTLAYARVGAVRSKFTHDSTVAGGQFGFGMQTSLTQNVDLRGEYDFTAYRSYTNGSTTISAPRSDAFNLGLVYKFD